jgi:hypothetical protein
LLSTQFWIGLGIGLVTGGTLGALMMIIMSIVKPRNFNPDALSADEIRDLNHEDVSIAPGRWPADRFYREKDGGRDYLR